MAYALVGSLGTVAVSASAGLAASPLFGTGETPATANELLVLWVAGDGANTLPGTPTGWSIGKQLQGTSCSVSIFYKVATGTDAAPVVAGATSVVWSAQLGEFSGGATSSPLDQTGSASTTTTSPLTITLGAADAAAGELVIYATTAFYNSSSGTKTLSNSLNNGATAHDTTNTGTNVDQYDLGYGITTGNSAADADTFTFTTTHLTGAAGVAASFKLLPADFSATGVTAAATIAAPTGAVAVTLPGAKASATMAASTGTVAVTLPGAAAAMTLAGSPGSIAVTLPGATAQATIGASAGTVSVSLPGAVTQFVAAATSGLVSVSLPSLTGTLTLGALAGSVTAGSNITITGATATVTFAAFAGSVDTAISFTVGQLTVTDYAPLPPLTTYAPGEITTTGSTATLTAGDQKTGGPA